MRYVVAGPAGRLTLYLERRPGDRIPDKLTWHNGNANATRYEQAADAVATAILCGDDTWVEEVA